MTSSDAWTTVHITFKPTLGMLSLPLSSRASSSANLARHAQPSLPRHTMTATTRRNGWTFAGFAAPITANGTPNMSRNGLPSSTAIPAMKPTAWLSVALPALADQAGRLGHGSARVQGLGTSSGRVVKSVWDATRRWPCRNFLPYVSSGWKRMAQQGTLRAANPYECVAKRAIHVIRGIP